LYFPDGTFIPIHKFRRFLIRYFFTNTNFVVVFINCVSELLLYEPRISLAYAVAEYNYRYFCMSLCMILAWQCDKYDVDVISRKKTWPGNTKLSRSQTGNVGKFSELQVLHFEIIDPYMNGFRHSD